MGISGLTTYVDKLRFRERKVWEFYDLHDTNLIIDGRGLCYYIYANSRRLNTKYGGQYDQFQKKVKRFFRKLQSNNVVPYVVIDGIMNRDKKKFKTHVKRKKRRIKQVQNMWTQKSCDYVLVLPRLVQLVFVQVLCEIKVLYAVADL